LFFFGFHNEPANWIDEINSLVIVAVDIHGKAADSRGKIDIEIGWNVLMCDRTIDQALAESKVQVAERFICTGSSILLGASPTQRTEASPVTAVGSTQILP
jgi:hypothetical protein